MITEQNSAKTVHDKDHSEMTVSELFEAWLASKTLKPDTVKYYRTKYTLYLENAFGEVRVNDITAERWRDFENSLSQTKDTTGKTLSFDIIRKLMQQSHSIFAYGKDSYGLNDPTGENTLPEINYSSEKFFSQQEVDKLKAVLKPYNVHHLGVMLCIETGIQLGELCGAKWGDVDTEKGILKIRRSSVKEHSKKDSNTSELRLTESRSERSGRDVHIPGWINDQLKLVKRMHTDDEMMIVGKLGGVEPKNFAQSYYSALLDKAGVKYRTFTATRNTYVKNSIENGMDAEELSRLLGNPSVEYTIEKYYNCEVE